MYFVLLLLYHEITLPISTNTSLMPHGVGVVHKCPTGWVHLARTCVYEPM